MIEYVCSWFTPTVLFCVLNLVIGTILITSTFRKHSGEHPLPPTPSLLQRVRSLNFPDPFSPSSPFADNSSPYFGHSPSFFQRVRSINFSFSRSEKPTPFPSLDQYGPSEQNLQLVQTAVTEEEDNVQSHVRRSKSAMDKSASEERLVEELVVRRRPAKSCGGAEEEAVDRKADDFINKFREQLKMQRNDSILRYKEMLNRGLSL